MFHPHRGSHRIQRRRARQVGIRRIGPVVLGAAALVLGSATIAAAYVTLIDNGTGTARASAIGAPTSLTATSSLPNQATLSWTAPSNPSPTGYTISQSPGTLAGTCTTLTGSSVSCTATGLSPGTQYTWQLVADYESWSSGTTTTTATTVTPSIALASTSGSDGTLVKVTGSGFAASSHLAFSFDPSGGAAPTTLTPADCTPTTTTAGLLPAGPCEVTVATAAASDGGTVTVTDAVGNAATAALVVAGPARLGTLTVAPSSIIDGSTGNSLRFTYTASGGALTGGKLDIGVASWVAAGGTAPQTTNPSAPGYTVASTGSVSYTGTDHLLEVTGATLAAGGTLTVTYGSGGGTSGVAAPAPSGTSAPYTFTASESATASGTLGALASSPQVTVVQRVTASCGAAFAFTLPAHTTVPFSVVGAGGGPGGSANGGAGPGGGAGGPGAAVGGTLANTTGSAIELSLRAGCAGGNGDTAPTGNLGGSGYAAGGSGGDAPNGPGAGGGGGGTTSIEIASTGTYLVVAGGGGGGGGGTTSGGTQAGEPGGASTTRTSSSAAANGSPGGASSAGTSAGGGGGGGGAGTPAAGGAAGANAAGGGGAGGESYPAGSISVGGVTVGNPTYGTGTPGAAGSATIG